MSDDQHPGPGPDLAAARERLVREKDRVSSLIRELRTELDAERAADTAELAHVDQHPADDASDVFEREKDLSILESLERELAEIEAAIRRVEEGTYGIDEVTGEPIAPERLEAQPTARTNLPHPEVRHEPEEH